MYIRFLLSFHADKAFLSAQNFGKSCFCLENVKKSEPHDPRYFYLYTFCKGPLLRKIKPQSIEHIERIESKGVKISLKKPQNYSLSIPESDVTNSVGQYMDSRIHSNSTG
jgi:hypothetical protein